MSGHAERGGPRRHPAARSGLSRRIWLALCGAGLAAVSFASVIEAPDPGAGGQAAATFQIRCWQNGRLLFEENGVVLPRGPGYALRLSGRDRAGRPIYVAETLNATCLIKPAAAQRPLTPGL